MTFFSKETNFVGKTVTFPSENGFPPWQSGHQRGTTFVPSTTVQVMSSIAPTPFGPAPCAPYRTPESTGSYTGGYASAPNAIVSWEEVGRMKPNPLTRKPLIQRTCAGRMKLALPPDPVTKKVILPSLFVVKPHPRTRQHHSPRLCCDLRLAKREDCASPLTRKCQPPAHGVPVRNSR